MNFLLVIKKFLLKIVICNGQGSSFIFFEFNISKVNGFFERYDNKKEEWIYIVFNKHRYSSQSGYENLLKKYKRRP